MRAQSKALSESVRAQIVSAGLQLLKADGIAALTQPRIARAASVTQSHLTYYFPTRANLLQAIAEAAIQSAFARLGPDTEATTSQRLIADIERVISEGIPPRAMIGLIVAADSDPEIRKLMRAMIRRIRAMIVEKFAQAGIDADDGQVLLFHASIVGLAVMHLARQNRESALEVKTGVDAAIRLVNVGKAKKR